MSNKKVDVIVDLQFGSTGKGAIAGYLGVNGDYDVVVGANRPNAGHTFIDKYDNVMIHKVLPNAIVGGSVRTVLIGGGAVFSEEQLYKEIDHLALCGYRGTDILIHESAVVLQSAHKEVEAELSRIGSTQQGAMAAVIDKMSRNMEDSPLAKDAGLDSDYVRVISQNEYLGVLHDAKSVLLEGAQGYSLGIDAGFWPYCTSRNCTVAQFLADAGVPAGMLRKVIGTARTFPIRVAGNSGHGYFDQKETTWAEIGQEEEFTTVTKKMRRVFTFSMIQIEEAIAANLPDEIFLNFVNYLPPSDAGALWSEINVIGKKYGARVKYVGHGASINDLEKVS